jgi:hypothetical protein
LTKPEEESEQTSSRKGRYKEILQNFINLKRFRKIDEVEKSSDDNCNLPKNKRKRTDSCRFSLLRTSPKGNFCTSKKTIEEATISDKNNDKALENINANDNQPTWQTPQNKSKFKNLYKLFVKMELT